MDKVNVEIVTPEKLELSTVANIVAIPGSKGDFGVLSDHSPMITNMTKGVIEILNDGKSSKYFVKGGFVEVTEKKCTILATDSLDVSGKNPNEIQDIIDSPK